MATDHHAAFAVQAACTLEVLKAMTSRQFMTRMAGKRDIGQ